MCVPSSASSGSRARCQSGRTCVQHAAHEAAHAQVGHVHDHRYWPPVTPLVGLQREATADTVVSGYRLPRSAKLWINVNAIHHDERFWPEPEVPAVPHVSKCLECQVWSEQKLHYHLHQPRQVGLGGALC